MSGNKSAGAVVGSSGEGDRQQDLVRQAYADTVTGKSTSGITVPFTQGMGYSKETLIKAGVDPNNAKMLGCGNPVKLADLQPGETVLDLGRFNFPS